MKSILFLLPVLAFGQNIRINPPSPVAAVGQTITITADRPVTFHLAGSGKITSVQGMAITYTAPVTIAGQHTVAGCMVTPSDSVFNTRIDRVPVNASSGSWTQFLTSDNVSFAFGWGINVVDKSTPVSPQVFAQTRLLNGALFPVLPALAQKRENGSFTTDSNVDHHMLLLNRDTCQFYETNQAGIKNDRCPTCTAQSGWTYKGSDYNQPSVNDGGGTTDGAGLPLAPLTLHLSELQTGSVNHALRFTACAECISGQTLWPATTSNGLQSGAPPMGARFRLKANFDMSSFPPAARTVLIALQRYGMILAGTGATGQISAATDVTEDSDIYKQLQSIVSAHLSSTDFEAVDESSFQLSAGSSAVNPNNRYQLPANYAMLTITDAANAHNTVNVPIALAPVAIGTPDPTMVVQGGTSSFQIQHWVTGTANQGLTWAIYPATGAGTITGDGFYTAPTAVSSLQTAVIQATSNADPTVRTSIYLKLIPNGGIRIDSGSSTASRDSSGLDWLPDLGFETGNYTTVNDAQNVWKNSSNSSAVMGSYMYTAGDDIVYRMHVPNGNYQVALTFGVGGCDGKYPTQIWGQNSVWGPLDLQSQATLPYQNWNFGTPIGFACRTPETVYLPAQVLDTTLAVSVRAAVANGQHSAALLNAIAILPLPAVVTTAPAPRAAVASNTMTSGLAYNLQQFDASCGQPGYNCQTAFQAAFSALAQAGGGTLQLPAGTFFLDFPGIQQNILGGAGVPARKSLLVVPPNTTVQGHLAADGTPDSVVEWKITSIPIFIFAKSSHSGVQNLHMRFVGTPPKAYPYGDIALLKSLGYHPTFAHQNQMSGGNYELFNAIYVFDSDFCTFDHLIFDSATHDNDHILGGAINIKAKGVIETNGGGLSQQAQSNRITNIQMYDLMGGITIAGQNNFLMDNVVSDRRGSIADLAPGHLLYTTDTNQFDPDANVVGILMSTNVTIQNITEGPHTYSNIIAGGTLAIKYLNGAQINNVTSQHPEGLIQTIYVDQNVTFSNMSWTSNYPLCTNVPSNCATPVIYTAASPANLPPTKNITFQNISLVSTASPITVTLMGDNLQVNGMQITTPPTFLPGQKATNSILNVKNTTSAAIRNYVYTPLLQSYDPKQSYNTPFTGWNPSTNVTASIKINWPKALPVPPATAHIIASGFQSQGASYNNSATVSILAY